MKKLALVVLAFFPALAQAQTTPSDPNGYAIVCNGYCTSVVPDENGNGASSTVILPQGYVVGRIDLLPGAQFPNTPGYEYKADPNDTMTVGSVIIP